MMLDHQDQGQDWAEFRPVLEMILGRLEACENMIEKIVTGFSGAITTQKRRSLVGGLREKHGEALGGISGIYGELVGRDPFDVIADEVMGLREKGEDFDEDGKVAELLEVLLKKFGKWIPKPEDVVSTQEDKAEDEPEIKSKQIELKLEGPRI